MLGIINWSGFLPDYNATVPYYDATYENKSTDFFSA